MSFDPVPDTPLEHSTPSPQWREVRLYQTSYLLKDYGLKAKDLDEIYTDAGFLKDQDPKILLAQCNPELFPVDINNASLKELLLVPALVRWVPAVLYNPGQLTANRNLLAWVLSLHGQGRYIKINGRCQTNLSAFMEVCS
jgi:hypothetical protein